MITREIAQSCFPARELGEIADFLDHKRRPVREADRKPGKYPYFGANGQQGTIDGYIFDEPLILLAEDGGFFDDPDRGIAYRISGKTWVNNHAHVIRPRNGTADFVYLCRVLENYDVRPFINGTTRSKLTKGQAERILIPLPPLDDQRRIAAILDKADALRRKGSHGLKLLQGVLQSIFVDMFGDPVSNLMSWPTTSIASIASKIGSGATPSGGDAAYKESGVSLVRSMNVRDEGFTPKGLAYIDEFQAAKLGNVALEAGDVLLNITGASVARVCLCPPEILPARVNQHVSIIRPKDKSLSVFVAEALKTPTMKAKLLGLAEAGATRQAITKSQIEQIVLPLPPRNMLERLRTVSNNYRELSKKVQLQLISMNALFSSLQNRAFSGQL